MAVKLGYQKVYRDPLGYPEWRAKGLPVEITPAGLSGISPKPETAGPLNGWAMVWTLLGIFVGGMALNLTPCVYPLIPITVSYFGGRSAKGRGKLTGHGLCYIGGLAITNSSLGVLAALTGGLMGAMLQNPFVFAAVAVILLAFAASLFGFWELRVPYWLTQAASKSYSGSFGSLFKGLAFFGKTESQHVMIIILMIKRRWRNGGNTMFDDELTGKRDVRFIRNLRIIQHLIVSPFAG